MLASEETGRGTYLLENGIICHRVGSLKRQLVAGLMRIRVHRALGNANPIRDLLKRPDFLGQALQHFAGSAIDKKVISFKSPHIEFAGSLLGPIFHFFM